MCGDRSDDYRDNIINIKLLVQCKRFFFLRLVVSLGDKKQVSDGGGGDDDGIRMIVECFASCALTSY